MNTGAKKAPSPIDVHVGQRVRAARIELGMSQERLGEALGLTFQQVQKYEKGSSRIGSSRMWQIATTLKRPVAWFFAGAPGADVSAVAPGRELGPELMATPYGRELALAFLAMNNEGRHAVVAVARALVKREQAQALERAAA